MSDDVIGEVVLTSEQVRDGLARVAGRLNHDFDEVVVITVVPGGMLVTADLVRQLDIPVAMDWISCPHTPGERNNSSSIVYHQQVPIAGRDVVVVDDAVESGGTMKRLVAHLQQYGPRSIQVAVSFVKPGRVDVGAPVHHGPELDSDEMLVGFGLPWQDLYRNLPYVARLQG